MKEEDTTRERKRWGTGGEKKEDGRGAKGRVEVWKDSQRKGNEERVREGEKEGKSLSLSLL